MVDVSSSFYRRGPYRISPVSFLRIMMSCFASKASLWSLRFLSTKATGGVPKALSAYILFSLQERETMKADGLASPTMKVLGAKWKSLSDSQKKPFILVAEEKREAAAEWKLQNPDFIKNEPKIKNESKTKRSPSGYNIFVKENYHLVKDANKDIEPQKILAIIGNQWADLDDESKSYYNNKSKKLQEVFAEKQSRIDE